MTVIVRGRINDRNEWTDQQLIYRAPADLYTTNGAHYGCRMIFDRQNHLFFSLGERGSQPNAQDLKTPLGKIHRVNDDGSLPKDNPFAADARRGADDLELRPSQSGRACVGSGHGDSVGIGARSEQRRRDQRHREGPQLRVGGGGEVRPAGHGVVDARAWTTRSSISRRPTRRRASRSIRAAAIPRGRIRACLSPDCAARRCAVSRSRGRASSARKSSSTSSAASATSCSRRTGISTLHCRTRRVYQIRRAEIFRLSASTAGRVVRLMPVQ